MDRTSQLAVNPFALLMEPETIFRAIAKSERLERLHSRICRPLDRPVLPGGEVEAREPQSESVESGG